MQYSINLAAGVAHRQVVAGRVLHILGITGATTIDDLKIEVDGFGVEELQDVKKGLRLRSGASFKSILFKTAVPCTVNVFVSFADLTVDTVDGSTVNANIVGVVPVSNDRGAPGTPVYVSGVTYSDAPATAIVDNAPVAVTAAGAAVLAVDATRKRARFTNLGPDPVTLGTTGHTWANRCIVLAADDTWVEDDAANLAWTAITDTGTTASVTAQEVIA